MTVAGSVAYVADYRSGLRVVDVSDPAAPFEVTVFDTPSIAMDVQLLGGYAYLADHSDGLWVVDVSDPTAPAAVGMFDTWGLATRVALAHGRAWVVEGEVGISVFDDCQTLFVDDFESGGTSTWSHTVP